jgi:hypothetical protein
MSFPTKLEAAITFAIKHCTKSNVVRGLPPFFLRVQHEDYYARSCAGAVCRSPVGLLCDSRT